MKLYIYSQRKGKIKKRIIVFIVVLLLAFVVAKLIHVYNKIPITEYQPIKAQRLSQTVEVRNEEDFTIAEMLENATNSVVGISKIKDTGSTVFTENGISQMGIGSGVIISENGYILLELWKEKEVSILETVL